MRGSGRGGFTLLEVFVCISVIGVLIGLMLSGVQSARASAARISCTNNLRQLGVACQNYYAIHGSLPPAYGSLNVGRDTIMTWPVTILPYIEQADLYAKTLAAHKTGVADYIVPPHVGLVTVIKTYTCPADARLATPLTDERGYTAAYGSYVGVAGDLKSNGAMRYEVGVRFAEVTDGTSNTLLIGERPPAGRLLIGNWYTIMAPDPVGPPDPDWSGSGISYMPVSAPHGAGGCRGPITFGPGRLTNPCDVHHFWSLHSGGGNFLFADGAVHFVSYEAGGVLPALATRAGGEVATLP